MEEIALVLAGIYSLKQLELRLTVEFHLSHSRIMSGGDHVSPERHGVIQEGLELNLGIAKHIGVRRAPSGVFAQELSKHTVFVVCRKIDGLNVDAYYVRHAGSIQPILAAGTVLAVIIVLPVLHEQAKDVIALLLKQPGRYGRVDTAGHANDDAPFVFGCLRHSIIVAGMLKIPGRADPD